MLEMKLRQLGCPCWTVTSLRRLGMLSNRRLLLKSPRAMLALPCRAFPGRPAQPPLVLPVSGEPKVHSTCSQLDCHVATRFIPLYGTDKA